MSNNMFLWVIEFTQDIDKYKKGHLSLHSLAIKFAMLGVGPRESKGGLMTYPTLRRDREFNEAIHHLLKTLNVREELQAYITLDSLKEKDDDTKIVNPRKGYDKKLVEFLSENPYPRYFP